MEVRWDQKITSFLPSFQICEPKMFVFILLMIVQFFAKNTEGKILIANCFVNELVVKDDQISKQPVIKQSFQKLV